MPFQKIWQSSDNQNSHRVMLSVTMVLLYGLLSYIESLVLVKKSSIELNRRGILIPVSCCVVESFVSQEFGFSKLHCLVFFSFTAPLYKH